MNVIQNLKNHIDVSSYYRAARDVCEKYNEETPISKIQKDARTFFNVDLGNLKGIEALFCFRYMVAEAVKLHTEGCIVVPERLQKVALEKAKKYLALNRWRLCLNHTALDDSGSDEFTESTNTSKSSEPKHGGPTKKQLAEQLFLQLHSENKSKQEIIEVFQQKLDMSRAGAQTYYYMMKKIVK